MFAGRAGQGQEDDWFGSAFITTFIILSALGILGGIVWELWVAKHPIVDLPLFRDRSFLFTTVMMFATLFVLQSTTQLLPQFVQQILPYDATKAGLILMPGGFVLMALMPVAGASVRKIQPKYLIAFGFIIMAFAMNHLTVFDPEVSFSTMAVARIFQTCGLAFLFVPITTLAYSDLPPGKSNNASALINLMRNLGGSVGISFGTTLLARHSQTHQDRLVSHLTPTSPYYHQTLQVLGRHFAASGLDSTTANHRALALIYQTIQTQSQMLAYLDIFKVLVYVSLIAAALTLFLKKMNLSKPRMH